MLHGIKLLYNQERFVPPFTVRRYAHADLSVIYKKKSMSTNEYEAELKLDEYAAEYYKSSSSASVLSTSSSSNDNKYEKSTKLFRNKYHHVEQQQASLPPPLASDHSGDEMNNQNGG